MTSPTAKDTQPGEFEHLRALPDGTLTQAEVGILLDRLATVAAMAGRHDPTGADHMEEMWVHAQRADAAEAENERLRDLLTDIYLYIDWRYITKQQTTEQRTLFADVVDATGMRPDRWWLPEAAESGRKEHLSKYCSDG